MKKVDVKKISSIMAIAVISISSVNSLSLDEKSAYAVDTLQDVKAISIKDQYIRINWNLLFDEYEVYVVEGGRREYVGTTKDTGFIFTNLKKNTDYEFLVRGLNDRDATVPDTFYISNKVTTGNLAGNVDKDNKLGYRTKAEKLGNTANIIIGSDSLNVNNSRLNYNIDLTRDELAGSKDVVVSIPADVVMSKSEKLIKIIGSDYTLSFSPNVFENEMLKSNSEKSDAGVRFKISSVNKNLVLKNANDKSSDIVSKKYALEAKTFVGSNSENIDSLNGTMNFIMDYDLLKTKTRRLKAINLACYDSYDKTYEVVGSGEDGTAIGEIEQLGTYLTIGTRR